jgi:hypothetical protein
VAVPIAKDAVDDGAQVELGAKSVKHQSTSMPGVVRAILLILEWAHSGGFIVESMIGYSLTVTLLTQTTSRVQGTNM